MLTDAYAAVDAVYRSDWGRIVATLIKLFGDFDLAEEAAQEAFAAAANQWLVDGIPHSPRAWVIQTARHKAIDRIRREKRFEEKLPSYALELSRNAAAIESDAHDIPDERLRLIFTCCHPALSLDAQVALLALMLLHDSRRDDRSDEAGDLVTLEEQDRGRWNHSERRFLERRLREVRMQAAVRENVTRDR